MKYRDLKRGFLLLGIPLLLTGCFGNNVPTLAVPNESAQPAADASLASVDAASLTPGLIEEFQRMTDLAKQWRGDAQVVAATVAWPPTLAPGRTKRVYVFGSATIPGDWWVVTMNESSGSYVRALIPKEDYLGPALAPLAMDYWKLNAVQALQTAEGAGGKAFREANPGSEITATLSQDGPNRWLWWVVAYRGLNGQELKVRIHPSSGEIYDETGQPVSSPAPSETAS